MYGFQSWNVLTIYIRYDDRYTRDLGGTKAGYIKHSNCIYLQLELISQLLAVLLMSWVLQVVFNIGLLSNMHVCSLMYCNIEFLKNVMHSNYLSSHWPFSTPSCFYFEVICPCCMLIRLHHHQIYEPACLVSLHGCLFDTIPYSSSLARSLCFI